jgi:hypothetical protein
LSIAADSKYHGSVYILDAEPLKGLQDACQPEPVQTLVYEHNEFTADRAWRNPDWAWRSLPPPPYAHAPGYCEGDGSRAEITCHAVDGSPVWVSTAGHDTYWLDTATNVWTKAGDWVLPFQGEAVPFPEVHLWLWVGFSAVNSAHICGSDVVRAVDEERPPAVELVWEVAVLEGFHEVYSQLVYLGHRQFCVAKVFEWTPRQVFRDVYWRGGGSQQRRQISHDQAQVAPVRLISRLLRRVCTLVA